MTSGSTKCALRALTAETPDDDPAQLVDEATDALGSVESATQFVAADGEERLRRAVVTAVRDGDNATVRRGRETLASLRAFRSALDGRNDAAIQFHPARGTVLGGDGKRSDR